MDILPDHQNVVFLQIGADGLRRVMFRDGGAVLVVEVALGLIENLPASPPGAVREVRVLQIERLKERVEPAQLQEFLPVIGGGAAAPVESGIEGGDVAVDFVAHSQEPSF